MERTTMSPDIIIHDDGLLPIDQDRVDRLAENIKEVGLINPICVERRGGLVYVVAGRHRLAAVKKLRLRSVPVTVIGDTDDPDDRSLDSRLIEIDENLIRGKLGPAEEALLVGERKQVYELKYPQTKFGAAQAAGANRKQGRRSQCRDLDDKVAAFIDDTAKRTGCARATVARAATRNKFLKEELPALKDTVLDKGTELDALVKLKKIDPEKVAEVVKTAKTQKPVRATAVLSEAQKRRIDTLGDHIHKRIQGTVLDTPNEIAALIKLRRLEGDACSKLERVYVPYLELLLDAAAAGKEVSAVETLAAAQVAYEDAKRQAEAEAEAFFERFNQVLGAEYVKLCAHAKNKIADAMLWRIPGCDDDEYENEDVSTLVPAE